MADNRDTGGANDSPGGMHPDAVALHAALSNADDTAEARDFLRQQRIVAEKQTQLLALQIADMESENRLRHWSLRFGNASAVMKVVFELAVAFIVLAIAAGIGAAVWTASRDNSLVIEAFSVPPDMANRGLTGQAVAAALQDRLSAMQDATDSARPADSYAHNWGDDIKVQIPDTGISISEFYRVLTASLGHQTHITGEVYRSANSVAISARAGSDGAATVSGNEANFDGLLQKMAQAIYARTQPYRYAIYAGSVLRNLVVPRSIMQRLTVEGTTPRERAWAFLGLGAGDAIQGNLYAAVADQRRAIAIIPDFALAWSNVNEYESTLGHDESALAAARKTVRLLEADRNVDMAARAKRIALPASEGNLASHLGDFGLALQRGEEAAGLPNYSGIADAARVQIAEARARLHEHHLAQNALPKMPAATNPTVFAALALEEFLVTWLSGDWHAALGRERDVERAIDAAGPNAGLDGNSLDVLRRRQVWPYAAYALAATGDFANAHALIGKTPLDCYLCAQMHGGVEALAGNWHGADLWFARAVQQAPSVPFAYTDWGAMLLAKGDLDGAIAKFEIANKKGPHFADPLEMWGEVLMAKNRSDLALAKFEEANKYAPNWGRVHLKWGEALGYVGQSRDAHAQFVTAGRLDLSQADKRELQRQVNRNE
jgi:tetratricopeptide (TPR) repeat protein